MFGLGEFTVADLEADELYDKVTKIHCFCARKFYEDGSFTNHEFTNYEEIKQFISEQRCLIGHNFYMYDIPTIEKILGVRFEGKIIDSLALSWYLYPERLKHGLEDHGVELGVEKPPINDWQNLEISQYLFRCNSDVEINSRLFLKQMQHLELIYAELGTNRIIGYLDYKMDCAAEQQQEMCKVDIPFLLKLQVELLSKIDEKAELLKAVMPKVPKYTKKQRPKVLFKKDSSLSANGEKWFARLKELGLPEDTSEFKDIIGYEEPKAHPIQLKKWLFDLGWEPTLFKYEREEKKNYNSPIVAKPLINDEDGEICPNIEALIAVVPELEHLKGLAVLNHRKGLVKSFIENTNEQGYTIAEVGGLTNTLRFKHRKPIANLPKIFKSYGKEIRGAIIAPEDFILCGSDMSGLEDNTKQHYMYFYDPDYVNAMRTPGFDSHLYIGVFAGMITKEDEDFLKQFNKDKKANEKAQEAGLPAIRVFTEMEITRAYIITEVRGDAKVVNFSAVYGVGAPKMSLKTGWPIPKCKALLLAYWKLNWSVKKIAEDQIIKIIFKDRTTQYFRGEQLLKMKQDNSPDSFMNKVYQMWLFNPVSQLYYSLRFPKDIFSTLNQGTGVYCFDSWVRNVRKKDIKITLQYHDRQHLSWLNFVNCWEVLKTNTLQSDL